MKVIDQPVHLKSKNNTFLSLRVRQLMQVDATIEYLRKGRHHSYSFCASTHNKSNNSLGTAANTMDRNNRDESEAKKSLIEGINSHSLIDDNSDEKGNKRTATSDVAAGVPNSSRSLTTSRKQSYDENDASVSSNDGDNENADGASLNESSNRFPLTTAEGQIAQNPNYTLPMATLAAKREYNRQNAARARKRAKTLLHTYQEQIQILTTQLAQLRDQNRSLLATLHSLREENIKIHQSQPATDVMSRSRTSDISSPPSVTTHTAGNGALSSTMETNYNDRNTAYVGSSVPLSSVQNQTIQNLLALLYLTGASIQQSSSSAQLQPTSSSSFTQHQPIAPDSQPQWFNNPNSPAHMILQQILPLTPSNNFANHQPRFGPSNFDAAPNVSRFITQSGHVALNHPVHVDSTGANYGATNSSTSSAQQDAKVGVENTQNGHEAKQGNQIDEGGMS